MTNESPNKKSPKRFDLEDRTFNFARECRDFVKLIPKSLLNIDYCKQLLRSSSSTASNYIEANESISRKDFFHRIRICRKEAKESYMWLKLIDIEDPKLEKLVEKLSGEGMELTKIFGKIQESDKN
ncbi:MAG: four helix bundle protein [Candidatus Gracilibacteria bacterium]